MRHVSEGEDEPCFFHSEVFDETWLSDSMAETANANASDAWYVCDAQGNHIGD